MKRMILTLAVAAGVMCGYQRANATPLLPGTSVIPDTLGVGTVGLVNDTGLEVFTTPGGVVGTVREEVITDSANPGGLDFLYQVKVTSVVNAGDGVSALIGQSFKGFLTDVGDVAVAPAGTLFTAGTVASDFVRRSAAPSGSTVTFDFGGLVGTSVGVGETSYVLIIRTNAQSYSGSTSAIGLTDGGTVNVDGFAPSPEPASLALFGCCFAGLGLFSVGRFLRRKPAATIAA